MITKQWRTQDFADVYAHFVLYVYWGGVGGGGGELPPHLTKKKGQGIVPTPFCAYFYLATAKSRAK